MMNYNTQPRNFSGCFCLCYSHLLLECAQDFSTIRLLDVYLLLGALSLHFQFLSISGGSLAPYRL